MEPTSIEARVSTIVCRLAKLPSLAPEQDYFDAGLASVQALELLLEVEEAFGVSLSDDQFADVRTVRQLTQLVESLAGAA